MHFLFMDRTDIYIYEYIYATVHYMEAVQNLVQHVAVHLHTKHEPCYVQELSVFIVRALKNLF